MTTNIQEHKNTLLWNRQNEFIKEDDGDVGPVYGWMQNVGILSILPGDHVVIMRTVEMELAALEQYYKEMETYEQNRLDQGRWSYNSNDLEQDKEYCKYRTEEGKDPLEIEDDTDLWNMPTTATWEDEDGMDADEKLCMIINAGLASWWPSPVFEERDN